MIDIKNKVKCCGCTACYYSCPVKAITMEADIEGFLYPRIDTNRCIHCNICSQVCPLENQSISIDSPKKIYAVKNNDNQVRMESSSGGVFSLLYSQIIENGGVVYGAAFDTDFSVVHRGETSIEGCKAFRGAKYVQSRLENTYVMIKKDLLQGKKVLFSGTPCQVAGLKNYLRKVDTSMLYTCDIVCHGVPSPLVWKKYLEDVSNGKEIYDVSFRSKRNGWHRSELSIRGKEFYISENHGKNPYSLLYFNHYTMRPSCSQCPFASVNRVGDITIGDFWGIEKYYPKYDDDKGISLVMIHTEKGEVLLKNVEKYITVVETSIRQCMQPNLNAPSQLADNRQDFWDIFERKGLKHAIKVFTPAGDGSLQIKIERMLYRLKRKIRSVGKKYD